MPKVDLKEVEKQQIKEDDDLQTIERREIGGKLYFRGKHLGEDDWFTDYGECHKANEDASRQKIYKSQGLDEFGRSPAQNALAKRKQELMKVRDGFLEEARKVSIEISSLKETEKILQEKAELAAPILFLPGSIRDGFTKQIIQGD